MKQKIVIVGGGAGGYFTAINAKENNPDLDIIILEKNNVVLQKVKQSGGGRCNVTHACFEPQELVRFYPRGQKELLGPFHQFMCGDTIEWFESHGVSLKIEADNRVFPKTNSSEAIIRCFETAVEVLGITVLTNHEVCSFTRQGALWHIRTKNKIFVADQLVITSGSSKKVWQLCKNLGHTIVEPLPSLFSFAINDTRLHDLAGLSVPTATVKLAETKLATSGALLITHWGMSGPAILKLSAFGARLLAEQHYNFTIEVNWLSKSTDAVLDKLLTFKNHHAVKSVSFKAPFTEICKRLWEYFVFCSAIEAWQNWADLSLAQLKNLARQLSATRYMVTGKGIYKDEFVSAGGIALTEMNFKNFASKIQPDLFFVGEVLNIDAVTGGFNFQNAWTGGYLCAKALAEN